MDGDDHAGQIGPVLCACQIPTVKQDRFLNEFAGAFAVVRLIIFQYFLLCRWVDPQRDTDLLFFQDVHLQIHGFAGRFTGSRCTRNWQMPHTGVPKAEKFKMRKAPERSPHCGLLWSGGGIYSHPPLSCNQIAGERQRIWRPHPSWHTPPQSRRFAAFSFWRVSSRFSAESSTRGHTVAYGRGFGLRGTFPSNRVKQLSV